MRLIEYKYPNNEIKAVLCQSRPKPRPTPDPDRSSPLEASAPLLDISSKLERDSSTQKPGYGLTPRRTVFGRNAIHRILCAGGALDKLDGGAARQVFCTGTLPGSTKSAKVTIANYSALIVHRLKAWVNRIVPAKMDFYVWELQKRGALHLHYVVRTECQEQVTKLIEGFKKHWIKILEDVSRISGVDMFARAWGGSWKGHYETIQADAQQVTKSVGAYLSCYLKKGANKHEKDAQSPYFPTRWFGISRPLCSVITRMSEVRESEIVGRRAGEVEFERRLEKYQPHSIKHTEFRHKFGLGKTAVFYYTESEFEAIWNMDTLRSKEQLTDLASSGDTLTSAIVQLWQECLLRRRGSLPRSKQQLLESALARMTLTLDGGSKFCKSTCQVIEFLGDEFGLNWISPKSQTLAESVLIKLIQRYWKVRRLADFRWDGSLANPQEICNFLDSLPKISYVGTNSLDGSGAGTGEDTLLSITESRLKPPESGNQQLGLF